ncbi:MAG: hypothetical protein NTY65_03280 [Planctomycetota bacterium]|nr:hypothetical protein [Planctomycetota bacterium]
MSMREVRSVLVAAVVALVVALSGVSAQAELTYLIDSDFTNNTLNGWNAGGPGSATPGATGVALGTLYPQNGESEDKEGNINRAPPGGMGWTNSGLDMIFTQGTGTKGGGWTYLSMWNDDADGVRRGYVISASKDYSEIYLRQILADGDFNQQTIAAPAGFSTGQHSMALVAFDDAGDLVPTTIAAYLDGVQLGTLLSLDMTDRPVTASSLQQIGVGVNCAGANWYIPQGTVVKRARAFTFDSGATDACAENLLEGRGQHDGRQLGRRRQLHERSRRHPAAWLVSFRFHRELHCRQPGGP